MGLIWCNISQLQWLHAVQPTNEADASRYSKLQLVSTVPACSGCGLDRHITQHLQLRMGESLLYHLIAKVSTHSYSPLRNTEQKLLAAKSQKPERGHSVPRRFTSQNPHLIQSSTPLRLCLNCLRQLATLPHRGRRTTQMLLLPSISGEDSVFCLRELVIQKVAAAIKFVAVAPSWRPSLLHCR